MNINGSIPGLEGYQVEAELMDDTPPTGVQTKFFVQKEYMPALSAKENKRVTQNFIYVRRVFDLGRSDMQRRIRDKVEWDEAAQKWKIVQLAPSGRSDILKNKDEWAAFYASATAQDIGTPLELLFRNDPSKVDYYTYHHIRTIELLANMNEQDASNLGHTVKLDRDRAREYLAATKGAGAESQLKYQLDQERDHRLSLERQVADLSSKLTELLKDQLSEELEEETKVKRGPGRPRTKKEEE